MKQVNGSCHCGAVKYQAEIDEAKVMLCHCTDCQIMSGSAYRGLVFAQGEKFILTGTVKNYIKQADSGNLRIQAFCPECGTHIYATSVDGDAKEKVYSLRLGAIAEKNELPSTTEIWCDSAQQWLPEISNTKKFSGQP